MRTRVGLLIILLVALPAAGAYAAEYHVRQDGTGDFTAIQAAIDASVDGDTVIVHPGTYYENINFGGKDITLSSLDPEDEQIVASTVIDGGQKGTVVVFSGTEDETCELSGFTLRNGNAEAADGGGVQDGIYPSTYAGAGISKCTISGNSAQRGGGLAYCRGTISNCTITGNSSTGEYGGGGLYSCWGPIINCTISNNSADYGGGLFLCGTIRHCTISGNSASKGGGLCACDEPIINCTISGNAATGDGGGLYDSYAKISQCTISGNSAGGEGSGLFGCLGPISYCIVWGNDGLGSVELSQCWGGITYCCIRDWTGGGEGNISQDPVFVKGPLGDFYLSQTAAGQAADSPCVDAGSMPAVEAGLAEMTTRTDGLPDTGIVDMGFHYPTAEAQVDVDVSCSLNAREFAPGDVLQGFMSVENRGVDVMVDIFAVITMPDGSVISLTQNGFGVGIWPWYSDLILPSGFAAGPEMVFELAIPTGAAPGAYTYLAAVSRAGMGSSGVLSVDQCSFEISEPVASDYYVDAELGDDANDGSKGSPWRTITHALDSVEGAAADPITIHVAAGTYSASTNSETFPLNMKSWVSLVGEDREMTVLNAETSAFHVITCEGATDLKVEQLGITGGQTESWPSNDVYGGGICCTDSNMTILCCKISGNWAYEGGGIACRGGAPAIVNNTISENLAYMQGGGISSEESSPIIEDNCISGNIAERPPIHSAVGGGIYFWRGTPMIVGNTISCNSANGYGSGGGIFISTAATSGEISLNTISGNSAWSGAGICYRSSLSIVCNTICDNVAGMGGGGGIDCWECSPVIMDNLIVGNTTEYNGGGIDTAGTVSPYVFGNLISSNSAGGEGAGIYAGWSQITVINNMILDNHAEGSGGGVAFTGGSCPTIFGNTIVSNSAHSGGGVFADPVTSVSITDSIIWGNTGDVRWCEATYCCIEDYSPGEGNISDDPLFVKGPLGDYYLDADSPCIDAGSRSAEEAGLSDRTTQTDGTPDTGVVDVGYHYPLP